jgi:hypothetical protein
MDRYSAGLSGFFYGVAINTLDLGTGTEHAAGFGFRKSVSKLEQNLFKAETSMIHARDHPPSEGFPPSEGRPPSEASSLSDKRSSGKPKVIATLNFPSLIHREIRFMLG